MVASYSPIFSKTSSSPTTTISRCLQNLFSMSSPKDVTSEEDFGDRYPVEQLKTLPSNTFGYQWALSMEMDHADGNYVGDNYAESDVMSGLHLLTGYGNDALGVAELQAFLFGTTGQVMSLLKCLKATRTEGVAVVGVRLYRAYQRGRSSYFNLSTWQPESLWDLPVQYVQRWLGL